MVEIILICVTAIIVTAIICLALVTRNVANNDHEEEMMKLHKYAENLIASKQVISRLMDENKKLKKIVNGKE